jgi:predicted phosphoribosyltransferase
MEGGSSKASNKASHFTTVRSRNKNSHDSNKSADLNRPSIAREKKQRQISKTQKQVIERDDGIAAAE